MPAIPTKHYIIILVVVITGLVVIFFHSAFSSVGIDWEENTVAYESALQNGCLELQKNYACDPNRVNDIIGNYPISNGSYVTLLDACHWRGKNDATACAEFCGCK